MAGDILYQGEAVSLRKLEGAIAEWVFDLKGDSVNKFNRFTLEDLGRAVACLQEIKTQDDGFPALKYKIKTDDGYFQEGKPYSRKIRVFNAEYVDANIPPPNMPPN